MFFPQHILPLLPLYNAQWWGYESLTAIVLVTFNYIHTFDYLAWIWKQTTFQVINDTHLPHQFAKPISIELLSARGVIHTYSGGHL